MVVALHHAVQLGADGKLMCVMCELPLRAPLLQMMPSWAGICLHCVSRGGVRRTGVVCRGFPPVFPIC